MVPSKPATNAKESKEPSSLDFNREKNVTNNVFIRDGKHFGTRPKLIRPELALF